MHRKYFSQKIEKFICIIEVKCIILQNQIFMETKLLDLNAYGVEEMSVAEMHETNGGWIIALYFLVTRCIGMVAVYFGTAPSNSFTCGVPLRTSGR